MVDMLMKVLIKDTNDKIKFNQLPISEYIPHDPNIFDETLPSPRSIPCEPLLYSFSPSPSSPRRLNPDLLTSIRSNPCEPLLYSFSPAHSSPKLNPEPLLNHNFFQLVNFHSTNFICWLWRSPISIVGCLGFE